MLRSKLTYYSYKQKTNDPAHGKLYLSQRQNSEGLDENVHLCSLISVIKSFTQNYECDSMHTLGSAKPFQNNLLKNTVCMMIDYMYMPKKC